MAKKARKKRSKAPPKQVRPAASLEAPIHSNQKLAEATVQTQKIKVHQMGHLMKGKVNLQKVVDYANSAQTLIELELAAAVTSIGDPNEDGEYETAFLADLLNSSRDPWEKHDIRVGVIDCPLRDELMSGVNRDCNCIIISLHNIGRILHTSGSTHEAYVLTEIAVQLLTIKYRLSVDLRVEPEVCERPWHRETKACLFDYCDLLEHTGRKLMSPNLCYACSTLLSATRIPHQFKEACIAIFNNGIKARFSNVLRRLPQDKLATTLFSGSVGGLLIVLIDKIFTAWEISFAWAPLVLLAACLFFIVAYKYYKDYTCKIKI